MGLGMLGVFIIVGIIMTATYLIAAIFTKKNDNSDPEKH